MLGPEGVTRAVHQAAKATLPARLAEFRERYSTAPGELVDFTEIYPDEVNARSIEKFPFLAIVIPATTGKQFNRQTDVDAFYEEYSYRYTVQLYAYAMGASTAATSKAIKRYTLAVREAFLANKILPTPDTDSAQIDPATLVESYSELDKKDNKFIAASIVQFEIVTHERLYFPNPFGDEPATIELGPALEQHPYYTE
ncbi:hypothetical protein Jinkies_14 [Arthrobacter phage Jinkies]|uniref:Tail terminator n=1 Tax=Arthrobacter phage Jinkies TaxID=2743903 RepID=A0A7S5WYH2_9CAUD|nr:hypothetical protein Jinkies_14 [Arthrobacter phage Jinkies]